MRRRLIQEEKFKPIIKGEAGDFVVYDKLTDSLKVIDRNDYDIVQYPLDSYIPIAIVVVPARHMNDKNLRAMSLVNMYIKDPENGSIINSTGVFNQIFQQIDVWDKIFPNYEDKRVCFPIINNGLNVGETQEYKGNAWYLFEGEHDDRLVNRIACNYFPLYDNEYTSIFVNPYDNGTKWYYGDSEYSNKCGFIPSPYLNDGNFNELFIHNCDGEAYTSPMTGDFYGKRNTERIASLFTDNTWETANELDYTNDRYESLSVQCCLRFHTPGTKAGDWYLPAAGEMIYVFARLKEIEESISKLISYGVTARNFSTLDYDIYVVSTFYSGTNCLTFSAEGYFSEEIQADYQKSRAFLMLS